MISTSVIVKYAAAVLLCLGLASPLTANTLIEQAYETGVLDLETARLYGVYEAVSPHALPAQYRGAGGPATCGTPAVLAALDVVDDSSPEYGRLLGKALQQPIMGEATPSPSGRFLIHYDIDGRDAVDLTDDDDNGIPDYIDLVAVTVDSAWRLEVDQLGYRAPPSDRGAGGSDEYDVYVIELGAGGGRYYGLTTPINRGTPTTPTYLTLDNNYTDAVYGTPSGCNGARGARGIDALHVTTAHEFFHAVQFGYYQGSDGQWWQEASATWMEEVAYPEVDDYFIYLCEFLFSNTRSLDSGSAVSGNRIYGASVFGHFLDQRYGRDVIRQTWEEHGTMVNAELSNFDRVLRRLTPPTSLADAVGEFGVWNYFTGHRHRPQFYHEGDRWPAISVGPSGTATAATVVDSGRIDHLTSAYFRLDPNLRAGGVVIENDLGQRTSWQRRLALVDLDTVEIVRSFEARAPAEVHDWGDYREVVVVLTNTDFIGFDNRYKISAEHDPLLVEEEAPLAFALKPSWPNPFVLGRHPEVWLPFDLSRASHVTRLSIFSLDGQLVWVKDLEGRDSGTYDVRWDGTNRRGNLVGAGIYYYALETDGGRATKQLAIIRQQ